MKIGTIPIMLTLVIAGLVIGCSSEPAAPTTTPVPVVRQIFPVEDIGQFLAQPNPKICEQCYLADADLAGANLTGAYLWSADLSRANLTGADLVGASLTEAYLVGADLTGAVLTQVGLYEADLTGAVLVGASLTEAYLREANLSGADLTNATLTEARLFGADLDGVIGADFTGALWDKVPSNYLKD